MTTRTAVVEGRCNETHARISDCLQAHDMQSILCIYVFPADAYRSTHVNCGFISLRHMQFLLLALW
jgi:hypothetical protein